MNAMEAIKRRISVRAYEDRPLSDADYADLEAYIAQLNAESGLHFQLYGPREGGAPAVKMSATMFAGSVHCYAALVAPDDARSGEMLGYYGEKLILHATSLGVGSCWVASTYDREDARAEIAAGERLWDIVPLGYAARKVPLKQRGIRAALRSHDKQPHELVACDCAFGELPEGVRAGIDAVIAGPSAINGQPVVFAWDGSSVSADLPDFKRDVQYNDLGIAKLHFQIAAAECGVAGEWEWGRGGRFILH